MKRQQQRWGKVTSGFLGAIALSFGMTTLTAPPALSGIHHDHTEKHEDEVEIQAIPANEEAGIYMLLGEGGNIGVLVGKDGAFLIDDQFAPLTDSIEDAVEKLSRRGHDDDIRFVINTHWHFDHTGGNENLGNSGTLIVAHDNVRVRMSEDQFIESIQMAFPASPDVALPVVTFSDRATFHLNEQTVEAIHVESAHTDGDSIIHFHEANVLHAGDTYFNGLYPFIDFESGGSLDGMIAATEQVLELADEETVIIPGHGPISDAAELVVYHELLVMVKEKTEGAIADGQSLEDFIASQPFAPYDTEWGGGFLNPEQFMTIVYTGLSQ